jgi:porin
MGVFIVATLSPVKAYDINDKFSISGVLAGAYQYQSLDRKDGGADEGGGAVSFQPELSFRPTSVDEFFFKLGFAADNGLNDQTPFSIAPWAASLEADVKNINGRDRDTLLTAWYKHVFKLGQKHELGLSAGLIDATDYLDENAYSNDEYTQFMNEALVNGPNFFFPSFDIGGAVEWNIGRFELRGVVMNVGENDDGNNFWYFGVQMSYTMSTALGEGNYRIIVSGTTEEFLNPMGTSKETRGAVILSFDQELGDIFGGFLRIGWQTDAAAIDFRAIYSGGVNIRGKLWRRPKDNIGIAYAYLDGGNTGIDCSQIFEIYARFVLNDYFAVTADLQYMDEKVDGEGGPQGWIPGIRLTAEF